MENSVSSSCTVTPCLTLLALFCFPACGGSARDSNAPLEALSDIVVNSQNQTARLQSIDGTPQGAIEHTTSSYLRALRDGDAQLLLRVASTELLRRIAAHGPTGDFDTRVQAFLIHEGRKLRREVHMEVTSPDHGVGSKLMVRSLDYLDGDVIKLTLRVGDQEIPKSFYLLRENGAYKVNVVPPSITNTVSRYRVQNNDYVERVFSCSGNGPYSIARFPNNRLVNCADSCHGGPFGWFDGTTFETTVDGTTAATDCDYNTWGIDMYIQFGVPVCSDPC